MSYIVSNIVILFWPDFWGFAVCSFFIALYKVLISGADETYLYLALENKEDYTKVSGSLDSINFVLTGIASIGVGYIYSINKSYPFIISMITCGVALVMALRLKNLKEAESNTENIKTLFVEFKTNIKKGFVTVINARKLRWFMLFSAIMSFSLAAVLETYQLFFITKQIPVEYFGWIYFLLYIVSSVSSRFSYCFKKFNVYKIFMLLLGMLILTPLMMSLPYKHLFMVIIIPRIVIGIYPAMIREYINKELIEDRATIFSIRSLMSKMMQVVLLPFVGLIIDEKGLNFSLFSIALIMSALYIILLISLYKFKLVKKVS